MDTEAYNILIAICDFLEGLFFGFCLVTLVALLVYIFYKKKALRTFINYAVVVARNLAIFYMVLYSISLGTYYSSKAFDFFSERATGPYAWAYWLMLLRPLIFCGLLQLFWIKSIAKKLRYVALITFLVLLVSFYSGPMLEKYVIIVATYSRDYDYILQESQFTTDLLIIISSYIIEKMVLFSALVFISWFIFKDRTLA